MKKHLLIVVALLSSSCTGISESIGGEAPAVSWVRASRSAHSLVGHRFVRYVESDPELTETQRMALINAVDDWNFMIVEGERLYGLEVPR